MPPPKGSCFSLQWGELLFQTNFIFVGTSLGHLSMQKIFQMGPTDFALKLGQKEGAEDPPPPQLALSKNWPIFLTIKMTFNLNKILYGVSLY